MSRLLRLTTAAFLAVGASSLAALVPTATAAPTHARSVPAADTSRTSTGIAKFGACLSGRKTADVVILLDESGSLQQSDPSGARVDAAKYLIKQWSALSVESGVKIAIQTMGFSGSIADAGGRWLDAGSDYPQLKDDLEAFRSRDSGQQTDYWMALDGARQALAQRAQHGGSTCQAILWFSDGKLDAFSTYADAKGKDVVKPYLDDKTDNAAATSAAAKDLCRKGGVADQVRSSGIATFAIGLAAGTATASDLDLMKSIALGENDCGAVSAAGTGDYHPAGDIDALILAFDALRTPGQLPVRSLLDICQGKICPEATGQFVLDDSITRVHVATSAKPDGLKLYVVPPTGKPVEVPMAGEKQTRVGGAEVTSDGLSPHTVALDFKAMGSWTGAWSVAFVDPKSSSAGQKSVANIELSADIEPTVTQPDSIHAGDKAVPISIGLRHHAGKAVDPSALLGTVSVDATFTDASGRETPLATGLDAAALGRPLSLDLTEAAEGTGTLTATVKLTTAAIKPAKGKPIKGTAMTPVSVDVDVPLLAPPGFPTVADKVAFGTATGAAKLEATVKATGPGCVWFDAPQVIASPEKAGAIGLTSPASSQSSCVKLAEGESKDIPVTLTTASAANGSANGSITAHLDSTDKPGASRTKQVAFAANFNKPVAIDKAIGVFSAALVLGIGIPVGLMYLVKRMNSKIPPLPLLGGVFDVAVDNGQVMRGGMPFALQPQELRDPLPIPAGGATSLTVGPAQLRVRNGWSPFGPGTVLASVGGAAGVSELNAKPRKDGAAELPLAIHNNWALFNAPELGAGQGRLLLLVSADAPPQKRQDMIDKALAEVPRRLQELAGAAAAQGQSGGLADPGGTGNSGPSLADPDATWGGWSGQGAGDPWATPAAPGGAPPADPWATPAAPAGAPQADPWAAPAPGPSPWAPQPSSAPADPWSGPVGEATMPVFAPPGTSTPSPATPNPATPNPVPPAFGPPSELTTPVVNPPGADPDTWATQPRVNPVSRPAKPSAPGGFDFSTLDDPDPSR